MAEIKVELNSGNQEPIVINRSRLTQLSSLSQSTSSPDSIQYGTIANSGSIEMTDYNEDIKALIKDGTLNPSDVDVSLYVNNNLVQKHLSTDSNYDSADKTFNISLSNKVKDMETLKYGGYVYQYTAISVFDLLKDVLSSFLGQTLSDANLETMLSSYMIHPTEGTKVHIYEYAKEINIKYPSIEYGRTYRDVIDELCTILQCYMYVDDNDDLVFESARPLLAITDAANAIRITKDKMYSPLKDAVILRNKFDGVEISEQNVIEETKSGQSIDEEYLDLSNKSLADYPYILDSELYTTHQYTDASKYALDYKFSYGTGSLGVGSTYDWANYATIKSYYETFTFSFPKKSNNGLTIIDEPSPYITGDNFASYKINYTKTTGATYSTYNTSTHRFTAIDRRTVYDPEYNPDYEVISASGVFNSKLEDSNQDGTVLTVDPKDMSIISYTEDTNNYYATCRVLVSQEKTTLAYMSNVAGAVMGKYEKYIPSSAEVTVLGKTRTIKFSNVSANTNNINEANTVANISTGNLIQNVTQVGSTQSGYWEDGVKITNIIKSTILEDYENGISNATVTICCDDFYNAGGTKVIDWSQGQTLQVGQVVFFTDDKYSDNTQRYWRITGRRFYWEGAPYCDLELQEYIMSEIEPPVLKTSGYYDTNNNLLYSWQDLISNNFIAVNNDTLTQSSVPVAGKMVIDSSIKNISQEAFYNGNRNNLLSVTIPSSIETIGKKAFYQCQNLVEINYNAQSAVIDAQYPQTADVFSYAGSLGDGIVFRIGPLVEKIPQGLCFSSSSDHPAIKKFKWNKRCVCTSIEQYGLFTSLHIERIEIPETITSLGKNAIGGWFDEIDFNAISCNDCSGKAISIQWQGGSILNVGKNVTRIPARLFNYYDQEAADQIGWGISKINWNQKCTEIGYEAFRGNLGLYSVTIPSQIINIGNSAFRECYQLVEVYNLSSLTIEQGSTSNGYIGYYVRIINTSKAIPTKITTIDNNSICYKNSDTDYIFLRFTGSTLSGFEMNQYITEIIDYAFYYQQSFYAFALPDGLKRIGQNAFYGTFNSASRWTIPASVENIGSNAISSSWSLRYLTFENPSGWSVYDTESSPTGTSISSSDLSDTQTAATYLKTTYRTKWWKRT